MAFAVEMVQLGRQWLRVGRQRGGGRAAPLLLFNGIGGNIELLAPITEWMPRREVITFDVPGVGHSPLPPLPYRMRGVAGLAAGLLAHYGHGVADVMGISWGGAAAQQFARSHPTLCRRLVLCATATGALMVPSHPRVAWKMATPRRFVSRDYARRVGGEIYGGDFRRRPALTAGVLKHVKWQSQWGYYLQLAAAAGWTSVHWLHRLEQPTLVMAGADDPLVPLVNARLMHRLLRTSELKVFDCGHLFLLTRPQQAAHAINEFLDRP
ncbi:MAG: poly(3-hydroxyalkanoate) depolymerase [Ideonella sp.]|nr:poly(3-hydroxyalkanoate) depolymerase [Ideonella sp.]MCC7459241.1 poly(3-hydroxyalkanoate) depolymerase [Nitrospira sp.]